MKQKFLAAKVALAVALTAGAFTSVPVQAGIPVIDGGNLISVTWHDVGLWRFRSCSCNVR